MWKREIPPLANRQMIGIYLIIGSILLLSHVTLFQLLAEGGPFEKPSVIQNTFECLFHHYPPLIPTL